MPDPCTYDYAIVRVVPRVERGEFVNVGAIVSSDAKAYLAARFAVDEARLLALDPQVDLKAVRTALEAIAAVCTGGAPAGAIGRLALRERFHWLVAPRSTIIQTSAVHTGRCDHLADVLDHLLEQMVRPSPPSPPSP
ncbi:MAG: DUF3037 domain-containing protein [Pseudomonadota bacterium]|nr:DUF3037 domain-containing protein [Pseudomonadota bacterium]